jgi:hypothetical protein
MEGGGLPEWLYDTGNWWVFLLITIIMGGAASFMTGRAIAQTWRPLWHIPFYAFAIACTVRFFHYALFEEQMMSAKNLIVDFVVMLAAAACGYRLHRTYQMARQYGWLAEQPDRSAPRPRR